MKRQLLKFRLDKMKDTQKDIVLEKDQNNNWHCISHCVQGCGYPVIHLDKQYLLHRAIWENSNGAIPKGLEISHVNGNRLDCRLENLECITHLENIRKKNIHGTQNIGSQHGVAKLKNEDIYNIRKDDRLLKEIAEDYNVSICNISKIINRKAWTHI